MFVNICLYFGEWITNVIETRWNSYLSEYFVSDVKDLDWGAKKWTQYMWPMLKVPVPPVEECSEQAVCHSMQIGWIILILPIRKCYTRNQVSEIPTHITPSISVINHSHFVRLKWVTIWVTVCRARRVSPGMNTKTYIWTLLRFDSDMFRMLERRVSNQRSELTNDQQMNYLLAWFNGWSDLQREDFIPVLAEKLSSKMINANGIEENLNSLCIDNGRPPSLFKCQVRLFILTNMTDYILIRYSRLASSQTGL